MYISPGAAKVLKPRTNVNMRPSGERAGWVTESGKFVSCTHWVLSVAVFLGRNHMKARSAAITVAPAAIYIQRRERNTGNDVRAGDVPESDNASSANAKSCADWNRCSGLFSKHRCTIRCSASGTPGASDERLAGSSLIMAFMVSTDVGFRNARWPVSTS